MSSYDWEEVKRLAADFQRTQLGSTIQKLSERNCVEIISKLHQLKLLDVVYTTDGKSYITPKYLMKEIRDELYVNNGRANLIDIAKALNVDDHVVSSLAHEIVKEDNDVRIILGQLIDHSFVIHLAEEISDRLQQYGLINVTELTRTFDLPSDFIHSVLKENCAKALHGVKQDKQDLQTYYTETYLNQNKAIIRGALMAITKPTLMNTVISHCGITANIFFSIIDNLIDSKQIPGIITERCGNVCSYIPQIYLKTQSEWVKNFYDQNGYLEYDALSRAGINDAKSFISKSVLSGESLQFLRKCAIGPQLLEQIEVSVDEAVSSHSWINILSILPTAIDFEDAETILRDIIKKKQHSAKILVFSHTYAVSDSFLNEIKAQLTNEIVPNNVNEMLNSGRYEQYVIESKINNTNTESEERELSRKEERKKRANVGKSGGGTQGRETKTKAVKKKYGHKANCKVESDDEDSKKPTNNCEFEFVSFEEIQNVLQSHKSFQGEDLDISDFVHELNCHLYPFVNKTALNSAHALYESKLANMSNTKRKMNADLHDTIISTYQDLKQYCKGIKEFVDEDFQTLLYKYLIKTTGTLLVNTCFTFVNEKNYDIDSAESRQKLLSSLDNKELRDAFGRLHKSLSGGLIDDFTNCVEDVLSMLNIMMKKMDKKKEKSLLESHKLALMDKLQETDDPSLVLHLATLILFQTTSQCMLNASGRFVAGILEFLKTRLPPEKFATLQEYHSLVLKIFKLKENVEEISSVNQELQKITPLVKEMVAVTQTNK